MNEAVTLTADSRPIVRARSGQWAPWAFAAVAAIGGLLLFTSLESARSDRLAPEGSEGSVNVAQARPLPELVVPRLAETEIAPQSMFDQRPVVSLAPITPPPVARAPTIIYRTAPVPPVSSNAVALPTFEPAVSTPSPTEFPRPQSADPTRSVDRTFAQRLANPSHTVAQGALIPAVLETALDSSRAGPARAIVSRDVRSFDRERVLIPRGSRLIGEYRSDIGEGQRRAAVTWSRLIRPDGVTIDLRSPTSDGLGRSGIRGRVNNHTIRRIGDALLQTMVGIGSGLTQRAVTQPVIVVPNGVQPPAINLGTPGQIQPTLTVAQGTRISVFVARDLDFSNIDQQP